jgi:hypothetical protein
VVIIGPRRRARMAGRLGMARVSTIVEAEEDREIFRGDGWVQASLLALASARRPRQQSAEDLLLKSAT